MAQIPSIKLKQDSLVKAPHLTDHYYLIRKHAPLVFSCLFLTVALTAFFTFTMKPVYRATSSILIDKETSRSPLTGEQLETGDYISQQLTFRTHFKVITSRPIMERVLSQLPLPEDSLEPGIFKRFFTTVRTNLHELLQVFSFSDSKEPASPEDIALAHKIDELRNKIDIEEVRDTRLLNIHVHNTDPQVARDIANTVAETYIQYDAGLRLASSRKVMDWLSKQLYEIKKKVEDAEREFLAFKEKENVFSLEGRQKLNVQKIEDMNSDVVKNRSQRMEVDAQITELKKFLQDYKSSGVRSIPTFLKNGLLESMYSELMATEVEYRRIAGVYRPKHPEAIKVTSKISELQTKLQQQLQKAMDNLEAERSVLMAREHAAQQATSGYESEAIQTNRKEVQYAILEREVQSNRERVHLKKGGSQEGLSEL